MDLKGQYIGTDAKMSNQARARKSSNITERAQDAGILSTEKSKYVTLADLSTEIVKRELNITSGWGKMNKYPTPDLAKAPQPVVDCEYGLIDGKYEPGEWQYCYLRDHSALPHSADSGFTPVNLQGKVTRAQAAATIFNSFFLAQSLFQIGPQLNALSNTYKNIFKDVYAQSGACKYTICIDNFSSAGDWPIVVNALGAQGMFDVAGGKGLNFRPDDYLTIDEAKIWFNNLNNKEVFLKGKIIYNPWGLGGDLGYF